MDDVTRIQRITTKLAALWSRHPTANLGALMEAVENAAYEAPGRERCFSPRLANLPDQWLEAELDNALSR